MTNLIAIALGPVQDFIAAARRSRDLWYGSYLLSEVAKAAARSLEHAGATLLFPYSDDASKDLVEGSDFTVANKLLALSDQPPSEICHKAKEVAQQQLEKAMRSAIQEAGRKKLRVDEELMAAQVKAFLEFSAVWVPYQPDQHQASRSQVELLLAARKTLRDFQPYKLGSSRPKSSLDGFRETILRPGQRPPGLFESNLKLNEHLDAIGLVKRLAKPFGNRRMPEFDSTIDVAARPYIHRIQGSQPFGEYWAFVEKHVGYKTSALLYEHESRQLFDQDEKDLSPEDLAALGTLSTIRNNIYERHCRPNPPYYAVMIGDGDFMGQTISGLRDGKENQAFSRALSRFAHEARELTRKHEGCPVYTGGDDVMALLPLHTVLDCAEECRQEFRQILASYPRVSFSAGIVIAHALEPLSDVLRLGRLAESRAKKLPGKDAVAFTLCPRSGATVEITGKWKDLIPLLRDISTSYLADNAQVKKLSLGFAHELREVLSRTPLQLDSVLKELTLVVAGKKQENEKALDLIERHGEDRSSLDSLARTMLVARAIYRSIKEARG